MAILDNWVGVQKKIDINLSIFGSAFGLSSTIVFVEISMENFCQDIIKPCVTVRLVHQGLILINNKSIIKSINYVTHN